MEQVSSINKPASESEGKLKSDIKLFIVIVGIMAFLFVGIMVVGTLLFRKTYPNFGSSITDNFKRLDELFDVEVETKIIPNTTPSVKNTPAETPKVNLNNDVKIDISNNASYTIESTSSCFTCGGSTCTRYKYADGEFDFNHCFYQQDYLDLKDQIKYYVTLKKDNLNILQNYDEQGCLVRPDTTAQKICISQVAETRSKVLTELSVLKQQINQFIEKGK